MGDKIGTFLMDSSFPGGAPVNTLLCELATLLLAYQEEGEALIPQVLVLTDDVQFKAVFPNSSSIELGQLALDAGAAARILKVTARLASESSLIFLKINLNNPSVCFGILHHGQGPNQPPPAKAIWVDEPKDPLAKMNVAILTPRSSGQLAIMTPVRRFSFSLRGGPQDEDDSIAQFVGALSLGADTVDEVGCLLAQGIDRCSRMGHGCIALMVEDEKKGLKHFEKRVDLGPHLNLTTAVKTPFDCDRACEMLAGMLGTDLAVLLSEDGRVLAFNAHIPTSAPDPSISGGARTQAWWAAKKLDGLKAGLIVSQDGASRFWKGVKP